MRISLIVNSNSLQFSIASIGLNLIQICVAICRSLWGKLNYDLCILFNAITKM